MKKIYLIVLVIFVSIYTYAQTPYNPFTQNIHFSPEPNALGIHNCGEIDVDFTMGMTTADDATLFATDPLKINICFGGFVLRSQNLSEVITGSYAINFDWVIDTFNTNCLIGIQNRPLPGVGTDPINLNPNAAGQIEVQLIIPTNLPVPTVASVDITLDVPAYMDVYNSKPDDNESVQTQNYISHTSINGSIYDDSDIGNNPAGILISKPDGTQLYINVVDVATGNIEASTKIQLDGHYSCDTITVNQTYDIQLSQNQGTVGMPAPPIQLPAGWIFTDEDCCDSIGNDGEPNGLLGVVATTCPIIFADFGISNQIPLSLGDFKFNASALNCNSILSWDMEVNTNIERFEILRKEKKELTFQKIKDVYVTVDKERNQDYVYIDENNSKTNNEYYYQLKIINLNQEVAFSPVRLVSLNCNELEPKVTLYPNPANERVNLSFFNDNTKSSIVIMICDASGRVIYKEINDLKPGQNNYLIHLSNYSEGCYFLEYLELVNNTKRTLKFTIY